MSTLLWHNEFKDDWMWALPLGNGRIGAMQYGNPHREQIEINEESLWSGRQIKEKSPFSMTLVCCNANGSEGYFGNRKPDNSK